MKLSIGFHILSGCVLSVIVYQWVKTNVALVITPHAVFLYVRKLVMFTYVDENQLIGYYVHRTDEKQFKGYAWNPHTHTK